MKEKERICRKKVKEIVVPSVWQGIACFFGHLGFLFKFNGKQNKIKKKQNILKQKKIKNGMNHGFELLSP